MRLKGPVRAEVVKGKFPQKGDPTIDPELL